MQDFSQAYADMAHKEQAIWDNIENNLTSNWTQIWEEKAKQYPDNILIVESETGASFSYHDMQSLQKISPTISAHIYPIHA